MIKEDIQKKAEHIAKMRAEIHKKIDEAFSVAIECTNERKAKKLQACSYYLSEVYSNARQIVESIENMASVGSKPSPKELENVFDDLVYIQVILYIGMGDWVKRLKKPLKVTIHEIGNASDSLTE